MPNIKNTTRSTKSRKNSRKEKTPREHGPVPYHRTEQIFEDKKGKKKIILKNIKEEKLEKR